MVLGFVLCSALLANGQLQSPRLAVTLAVVDEEGLPVDDAQVTLSEAGRPGLQLRTDYAGRCTYSLLEDSAYQLAVKTPGFYQSMANQVDGHRQIVEVVLAHEQVVRTQVNVVPSTAGIDIEQTSDKPMR